MTDRIYNAPKLRFPIFNDEWEDTTIGQSGRVIRGASPRPKGDKRYYGGSVPRLMVEDVTRDGKYVTPKTDFLTEAGAELSRPCKAGTLTIVCSGTVGVPSILAVDACIHDGFLALVDLDDDVDLLFLYAYISRLQKVFDASATHGGIFVNLTTSILRDFPISLPSLSEQQAISSFFDSLDNRISLLSEKLKLLNKFKRGCMQNLFSQKIRFKDDQGNDFSDWKEYLLGDVVSFSKGKGISKNDIVHQGQTPCIRYGEIYTMYRERITKIISSTDAAPEALILSESQDVIIPASGEDPLDIARACCVEFEGVALGGDINILRGAPSGLFLAYYINNAKRKDIARLAQGSSVVHLYGSQMKDLEVSLPSPEEQRKIADFISKVDVRIDLIALLLSRTQTYKKGLLQQMFI